MNRLDYPEGAKPWMEQIDHGDIAGFRRWAETGGAVEKRDPASGTTPLEYAALSRDFNLYLGQRWANEDGKRRRKARWEMAKLLVERGAEPGHAFVYAVPAGNFEIAGLLPLERVSTEDLREAWDRLQSSPAAAGGWKPPPGELRDAWERRISSDSQLLAAVEKELAARKRKSRVGTSSTTSAPPVPSQIRVPSEGPEALAWLRNNENESALASNRFGDTAEAIRFVEELYAAGAARVIIPEENIMDEGGNVLYADALVVYPPPEASKREAVFRLCDREWAGESADLPAAEEQEAIFLWWD
jgi:hypothetical protein